MNLGDVIDKFSGMLIIGDVHADLTSFLKSYEYAKYHNLFFVSLGDLVDRGSHPFETVMAMRNIILSGTGAFVIGNHDSKHYRYSLGNNVIMTGDPERTLNVVGSPREAEFYSAYKEIIEHTNSYYYHYLDNWVFAHGATHYDMWEKLEVLSNSGKAMALYGEVTGNVDRDNKPERIYNWVDKIPENHYAVVGHDRKAVHDSKLKHPLMKSNLSGGTVLFLDTGCGKGGVLSGLDIRFIQTPNIRMPIINKFVQF